MRTFIFSALGFVVAGIVGEAIGAGLFATLRRLYRPPHGRAVLLGTWLLAIIAFIAGARHPTMAPLLQLGLLVGFPMIALIALLVTRDLYRAAAGKPLVNHHEPGSVSGLTRVALLVLGAVGLLVTLLMLLVDSKPAELIAPGVLSLCFLVIGIRRQIPPNVGHVIGAPPDAASLD